MSIIETLHKVEHSTLAFLAKQYQKLHAVEPEIKEIADRALPYIGAMLQVIVGHECGSGAGAGVAKAVSTIQRDIDVASAVIADTGANATTSSMIGAVAANVASLATATGIKNPASLSTLERAVAAAVQLANVLAAVPVPQAPASNAVPAPGPIASAPAAPGA